MRQPYAHTPAEDIRREIETSVDGNEDMSGDGLKDLISTERTSQLIVVVVRTKSFVEIDLAHFDVESIMLVKYYTLTLYCMRVRSWDITKNPQVEQN